MFSGNQSMQESYSTSGPLVGLLQQGYAQALRSSNKTYAKILQGYAQVQKQYRDDAAAAQRVYGAAMSGVSSDLDKTGAAEKQAIIDQYVAARGAAKQNLINKGLGNSTVQSSVDRGLEYDRAKADVALTGNLANIRANYRSQIGIAQGNAATQLAGGMAQVGAAGWGVQSQGAAQRSALAANYMGQLHSSQSRSTGNSTGQSRGGVLGGGGGGYGSSQGFGPVNNPLLPAAYPMAGFGGSVRPSPYGGGGGGGGGANYSDPIQGQVQYFPASQGLEYGGYESGGDYGGDDYSQLEEAPEGWDY